MNSFQRVIFKASVYHDEVESDSGHLCNTIQPEDPEIFNIQTKKMTVGIHFSTTYMYNVWPVLVVLAPV